MKKTSLYMRKRLHLINAQGDLVKKHPMSVLRECRTFNEEDGTDKNAISAMDAVRAAFSRMADGVSTDVSDFDYLAHALGVAEVRAVTIGGNANNPLIDIIAPGNAALGRCRKRYLEWGRLQLDNSAKKAISDALDVYEQILVESSPRLMADAVEDRIQILREKAKLEQPNTNKST